MPKNKFDYYLNGLLALCTAAFASYLVRAYMRKNSRVVKRRESKKDKQIPISLAKYRAISATKLAQMIREKKITSSQLVKISCALIHAEDSQLNSVISLREQAALNEAAALKDTGQPFYGVPLLIKGLGQELTGEANTRGLVPLKNRVAAKTSDYVKRVQSLGFIIIGQTNFPELGLTNTTKSKLYGTAHNPWNSNYNTGGSSGGAVAAVAQGFVPLATGNDAGGSLRIPASFTGVIGLKPTQGVVVGDDLIPSTVNFVNARDIKDVKEYFAGVVSETRAEKLVQKAPKNLKKYQVAYSLKSPVGTKVSFAACEAVLQAVDFLRSQGFTVVNTDAPVDGIKLMMTYYTESTPTGTQANKLIKKYTGADMKYADVSPMTWALYQADKKQPDSTKKDVQAEIDLVDRQMSEFHQKYPLYLTPTTAQTAAKNSEPQYLSDDVKKLRDIASCTHFEQIKTIYDAWLPALAKTPFTQLANLSGESALSLPTYVAKNGLPLGIQFEAAKGQDQLLLEIGQLFQEHQQLKFLQEYR